MKHYKTLMPSDYLGAWDLTDSRGNPADVEVTITGVDRAKMFDAKAKTRDKMSEKWVLTFAQHKPLVLSKTHTSAIAAVLGADAEKWVGQQVTLYPAQTLFGRGKVECIRVRLPLATIKDNPCFGEKVRAKLLAEYSWALSTAPTPREQRPDQSDAVLMQAITEAGSVVELESLVERCKAAADVAAVRDAYGRRKAELMATREPGEDNE
jgi:hypothetical protein